MAGNHDEALNLRPQESEDAYIVRICGLHRAHMELQSWYQVAALLNEQLGYSYDESTYRKKNTKLKAFYNQHMAERFTQNHPEAEEALARKYDELYKMKVRAQDANRERRAELRYEGRLDELKDHITFAASRVPIYPITREVPIQGQSEGVVLVNDWHIGAWVDLFWNKFNIDIARERVEAFAALTVGYCRRLGVTKLHVLNLMDLIEGNIHVTTRVMNELDVIESTMKAGELLVGFLTYLEKYIPDIEYGATLDNHGRVTANYKEHIEAENFGRFIAWWMEERLKNLQSKVKLVDNYYDPNIGKITLRDGRIGFYVHGHIDKQTKVFENLTALTREIPSFVFMGHTHLALAKEHNYGEMFVGGSLKGMDDYGLKNRYVRTPSQKLIVFEDQARLDINLDLR